ncbi:alpha/beta-hydrolase [Aspergillus aculeatinus CBS 121060]|uniref:Alpha/beta-hydrolase n=1 Tax=Aspergillus aculeatinus CBS 121060 TaxID=1448322 RepID=A0ACD1H5D0_9EURO|nr:alpha/beta-hydrolase [Aspergillus aculeatinus CBS 121060]RAH68789.1 alpha/beta-hydrolase [Aspergillus aculeatinus CBS 121060]
MILKILGLNLVFGLFAAAQPNSSHLPIVDLGYELHQAISYEERVGLYNFSNIRYAAAPVGDLRFRAPAPPMVNRSTAQQGSEARICPQALPSWMPQSGSNAISYVTNGSVTSMGPVLMDPRASEDCLFLDVVVPKKIFETSGKKKGAPVLVWIYGGGYTGGSKTGQGSGSPVGLLRRGKNEFIYVAINCRLGAFGWLSGSAIQRNGAANSGLLDQRFALEWVQQYIHLFGGDPNHVTVIGESAGGGSILHQITAYGGSNGPVPFQQAILQSPAFIPEPILNPAEQERIFNQFLRFANVSTLEEARRLPSSVLMEANRQQVYNSPLGSFTYGPVVDGIFVPESPSRLLRQRRLDTNVTPMLAYNGNDGIIFSDFSLRNNSDYQGYITGLLHLQPNDTAYVSSQMYPPIFDGSHRYTDEIGRAGATFQEAIIQCNDISLALALSNATFNYVFDVFPGLHAQDISATFDANLDPAPGVFDPLITLQQLVTSFTLTGTPTTDLAGNMPMYGRRNTLLILNATSIGTRSEDPRVVERCEEWYRILDAA